MRYNIFHQIHKALRALLHDTALMMQRSDVSIAEERSTVIARLQLVADMFDDHAKHEDEFVFPAIQQVAPSVVAAFEAQHHTDMALANELREKLAVFTTSSDDVYYHAVVDAFQRFMVFNLEHMSAEEQRINPVLWKHFSDEQIIDIDNRIVASLSPWSAEHGSEWMLKGLNLPEIIKWLSVVKQSAPPGVLEQLLATAKQHLPAKRFHSVLHALTFHDIQLN